MSLRKKRPGKLWITGVPRAQLRKVQTLLNSINNQIQKLVNAGQPVPFTVQQQTDMAAVRLDIPGELALKS